MARKWRLTTHDVNLDVHAPMAKFLTEVETVLSQQAALVWKVERVSRSVKARHLIVRSTSFVPIFNEGSSRIPNRSLKNRNFPRWSYFSVSIKFETEHQSIVATNCFKQGGQERGHCRSSYGKIIDFKKLSRYFFFLSTFFSKAICISIKMILTFSPKSCVSSNETIASASKFIRHSSMIILAPRTIQS